MAKSDLNSERVRELLDYNAETGVFRWRNKGRKHAAGAIAGSADPSHGYIRIVVDGELCYAHRLAWLYMFGEWPRNSIDHMNGDNSDNSFGNLRDVTQATNAQNIRSAMASNRTTGMLGASLRKDTGRYTARMRVPGKYLALGCFDTPEQAHEAYVEAKRRLHAGCTI